MMRHFLSRLWYLLEKALHASWHWCKLNRDIIDDLILCTDFLHLAHKGMSMNNLVFRKPTHHYRSDACEYGLGGYSLTSGHAWHFQMLADCQGVVHINSLEFVATLITSWVDLTCRRTDVES